MNCFADPYVFAFWEMAFEARQVASGEGHFLIL
jgi:hypothetical protein